jgi:hypothetical protein
VRIAQRSLALRPAHSRGHLYVTCYTEGFSLLVASMTAPVAPGSGGRRVGLPPTGKRRLLGAHTLSGRCGGPPRGPSVCVHYLTKAAERIAVKVVVGVIASGSIFTWIIEGDPEPRALSKAGRNWGVSSIVSP